MSLISPERQYAINYEISRETPTAPAAPKKAKQAPATPEPTAKILQDDLVTLQGHQQEKPVTSKIPLQDFQTTVGQDRAMIQATLRNKLAEYGLRPNLKAEIVRDESGKLRLLANAPQTVLSQINQDLNNNGEFRAAFTRLSQNQPTLDYVANVKKLSSAYGSANRLFNSLVSSHGDNNSLSDIATRYDNLKQTLAADSAAQGLANSSYRFVLNV